MASGLTVSAEFNGDTDPAYVTSSAQLSYDVDTSLTGVGEGTPTAYSGLVWTKA